MKTIFLLVCLMVVSSYALTARVWNGGSSDMNSDANYTGGSGALGAGDSLIFDATSTANATATGNLSVGAIKIASTYTGAWSVSGYTITLAQGMSDDGTTGAHHYGNGITLNGNSATFHIGSGVNGTLTGTSCPITMNGTTAMVLDQDRVTEFKCLTLGAGAKVTATGVAGASYFTCNTTILTLGANAEFTNNTVTIWQVTASATLWSLGSGYVFKGNGVNVWSLQNSGTLTVPAINYTGVARFAFQDQAPAGVSTLWNLAGDINVGTAIFAHNSGGTETTTLTTNDYTITCGAMWIGCATGTSTYKANFGGSNVVISSYDGTTYNSAGTYDIKLDSSYWTCAGNWTNGNYHKKNTGEALVNFINTATVVSSGNRFPTIMVDASGKDVSFTDRFSTTGSVVYVAGKATPAVARDSVALNITYMSTTDSVSQRDTCYVGQSYTMSASAKLKTRTGKVKFYGGDLCNLTTSNIRMLSFDIVGADQTKEIRALDNVTVGMIRDSTGFLNMVAQSLTADTLILNDTAHFANLTVTGLLIINVPVTVTGNVVLTGASVTVGAGGKFIMATCDQTVTGGTVPTEYPSGCDTRRRRGFGFGFGFRY